LVAQALACDFPVHANPGNNHRLKSVPRARRRAAVLSLFVEIQMPADL
jgi:hypothetical protein